MATIDIRATVTCSLGELISGSVNDDYIQGGGVVKTRGSCELLGIHAPAVGTAVTFSYVAGGATKTLPRKLRVLSSFADPFRKTTKVELGCLLTYKSAVTPVPTVDGQAAITSGRQQQCLNGYAEYPADAKVPFPIRASGVMQLCLDRLGITASGNPLTNVFLRESFDLSSGYVNVISELLESEGYFGYMDEADVLQVRDLTAEGGSGPVVDGASLIDLGAIGVGDLPGEAVVVRYDSLSLDGNLDTSGSSSGQQALKQADWEKDEVVGSLQTLEVRYTSPSGGAQTATVTFTPYSETVTEYGKDQSWQDTVCIISSLRGEGADLTNSVLKRTTHERCVLGAVASNYCSELLSSGFAVDLGREGQVRTEEEYEYDQKGETTRRIRRTYEPFFKWMGGIDMTYVYATASGVEAVPAPADEVLTEEVIETYETIYGRRPPFLLSKPGEVYEPPIEAQKTTTTTYQNWALTQQGQQGAAQIKESAPFANAAEAMAWLKRVAQTLVLVDTQLQTDRTRNTAGQVRAQSALRLGGDSKKSANTEARLIYALGSASSERFATFSMPYQSDDYLTPAGVVIHSDASGKALRYGRIQNRLLLGNRNGANLQLPPSKMPAHPFDPLYLSDGSLMVQYRANAINWAFSKDGIVSSVDALYWGVAGGSGTPWVPVAPGITTFPPLPPVVGGETSVPGLVPPWNETVPTVGITRTTAAVQDFNYVIGSLGTEDLGVVVTRTKMQYSARLSADGRVFNLTGADANWKQVRGFAAQAGAFNVTGMAADRLGFYVLKGESGALNVGFRVAELLYQRIAPLGAGAFLLDGHAAGSFNGKGMALDGTTFLVTGQDATFSVVRRITAEAGVFVLTGHDAMNQQDDYFSTWATETYGYERAYYPEWWAD
jgi:hypothetical protein